MILLTEIKLEKNCGNFKTDKEIDLVKWMVPDPITRVEVLSAIVTLSKEEDVHRLENKLGLPVIWSVMPESMTHFKVLERRHLEMLPISVMAITGVESDVVNDS